MQQFALIVIGLIAAASLVVGIVGLFRLCAIPTLAPLDPQAMAQVLRAETEFLRQCGDEQARGLRQELGEAVRGTSGNLGESIDRTLRAFGERLDKGVAAIDKGVGELAQKLDADIVRMGEEATRNRDGLRQQIDGKLDAAAAAQSERAKDLREELGANFHRLGGQMAATLTEFGDRQKERLDAGAAAVRELGEKHEKNQESLRLSVEARLDAIRLENARKLDEMRQTVDEKLNATLDTRLNEHFSRVVEQLSLANEKLGDMKNLASGVDDLRNVLTNVKVRGTFGEVQLEWLLEQFLTPDQYVKDAKVRDNTAERVEFAIRFPGKGGGEDVLLPVDAKFPRETYDRLQEASERGDPALLDLHRKQLQAQIRNCAKEIRDKYVRPPRTTDFALMFLPTEGLFAEVLRQPGLFETLQREFKVTLAGPTTLSALLNAFQMGFRSLAIERRSSEVWQILAAIQSEFGKYNSVVEKLAKHLNTAATSVESLGKRTRAMSRKLKSVEVLPSEVSATALLGLDPDDGEGGLELEPERSDAPNLLVASDED